MCIRDRSYLDHGRRVVLLTGDVTPERVARFRKQVQKNLKAIAKK